MSQKQIKILRITEPIRDINKLLELIDYYEKTNYKAYMLFITGINTKLRIGDLVELKVSDIATDIGIKQKFSIIEQKTGKGKTIGINDVLKSNLELYIQKYNLKKQDYLFFSRKNNYLLQNKKPGHITRIQAWRILKKGANDLLIDNFGTHTMRKTWGNHQFQDVMKRNENPTDTILSLVNAFNHSSVKMTLKYIGLTEEREMEMYKNVQLGRKV